MSGFTDQEVFDRVAVDLSEALLKREVNNG